ncbi:MAG: hypothetical protein JOZ41_20265 [Chloroflexi bacterium]|nr:hypothetical protein [Chloroflexota bacterium]
MLYRLSYLGAGLSGRKQGILPQGEDVSYFDPAALPLELAAVLGHEQADTASGQGRWASGPAIDGKGQFSYIAEPFAVGMEVDLPPAPKAINDSLPGDLVGRVMPPKQASGSSAECESFVETTTEKITRR